VTPDLDTLLIALYVEIDDHVIISGPPRAGQPKRLSDAELVCLAVAQVLLGARSEHHWLRMCYGRLGHLFPYLPKQPGYHKRLKAAGPLLAAVIDHLTRQSPSWYDAVRLIDATPVPCGASRGDRQALRAGRVGALWLLRGAFSLVLGAEAVPDHHPGRHARRMVPGRSQDRGTGGRRRPAGPCCPHRRAAPGPDSHRRQGLRGPGVRGPGRRRVRHEPGPPVPPRRGTPARSIGRIRQWIESVNDTLKGQLDLEQHGGRTTAGLYARIAQRLPAMGAAIWHNWAAAAPAKRSLITFDN
jgi:hypothetical protein